jgi:CRP/FNR family transcriptional regulator, cyclic AMP receptor protein
MISCRCGAAALLYAMPRSVAPDLPAIGILESLDEESRAALAAAGDVSTLPEGAYLMKQGDQQERLYLLLDGKLSASCRADNSVVELGMMMPGESVGEMNVIDPRKTSADVKAVRASRVWSISKTALEAFMEAHPEAGMRLMRALAVLLCRRVRKASDRMLRQAEMAYAVYEWLD